VSLTSIAQTISGSFVFVGKTPSLFFIPICSPLLVEPRYALDFHPYQRLPEAYLCICILVLPILHPFFASIVQKPRSSFIVQAVLRNLGPGWGTYEKRNEIMGWDAWRGPCKLRNVSFFVDRPLEPNKSKSKLPDHLSGESSQINAISLQLVNFTKSRLITSTISPYHGCIIFLHGLLTPSSESLRLSRWFNLLVLH